MSNGSKHIVKLNGYNGTKFYCRRCKKSLQTGDPVVKGSGRLTFRHNRFHHHRNGENDGSPMIVKPDFYHCVPCGRFLHII